MERAKERTFNYLFRKDKNRLISVIKGMLSRYNWLAKKHWGVRLEMAEDIFQNSIQILLKKFPHVPEESYRRTEKLLYAIIRNEVKRYVIQDLKNIFEKLGKLDEWYLGYNERERMRDRREYNRKQSRKRHRLLRKDPGKWAKKLEYKREHKRLWRKRKKEGTFKDERFFDPNNPFKHMKITFPERKKNVYAGLGGEKIEIKNLLTPN